MGVGESFKTHTHTCTPAHKEVRHGPQVAVDVKGDSHKAPLVAVTGGAHGSQKVEGQLRWREVCHCAWRNQSSDIVITTAYTCRVL